MDLRTWSSKPAGMNIELRVISRRPSARHLPRHRSREWRRLGTDALTYSPHTVHWCRPRRTSCPATRPRSLHQNRQTSSLPVVPACNDTLPAGRARASSENVSFFPSIWQTGQCGCRCDNNLYNYFTVLSILNLYSLYPAIIYYLY